jgi:protein disulfide-isomerase A1
MEPEYNHLAAVLRDIPSIVIAKMDGTKNEHSLVEVSYFFQLSHHPSHSCSIR